MIQVVATVVRFSLQSLIINITLTERHPASTEEKLTDSQHQSNVYSVEIGSWIALVQGGTTNAAAKNIAG